MAENTQDKSGNAVAVQERPQRNATKAHTAKGLGRHWSWENLVRADDAQFKLLPEAPSVPCMCFDGEEE